MLGNTEIKRSDCSKYLGAKINLMIAVWRKSLVQTIKETLLRELSGKLWSKNTSRNTKIKIVVQYTALNYGYLKKGTSKIQAVEMNY